MAYSRDGDKRVNFRGNARLRWICDERRTVSGSHAGIADRPGGGFRRFVAGGVNAGAAGGAKQGWATGAAAADVLAGGVDLRSDPAGDPGGRVGLAGLGAGDL